MIILAIDAGTTALKVMRADSNLRILSTDRIPTRGLNIHGWVAAIRDNLRTHGDSLRINTIAITGQMHGLVLLEDSGYGEGVPWTDQRGASMLPPLNDALGPDVSLHIGGPLASGFQAVSLAWIKTHDQERWMRIRRAMLPKDALIHALTGRHVTDPSDAAGTGMLDIARSAWAWDVVDTIGIPHEWLPEIIPSGTEVGAVTATMAEALGLKPDVPVVIAGGDAPVGAFGGGVIRPGQALIMLSTGAQIILPTERYTADPAGRWYTWLSAARENGEATRFLQVGTLLNAGIATGWLRSVLAHSVDIPPEPTRLIVLPHLIGERTLLRDPLARGAVLGITPQTTPGELSRAVLEGIAYALRHALEEMCGERPMPELIRLGGGGAQNEAWQAIITHVLGIQTERMTTADLSAFGAAALASGKESPGTTSRRVAPDSSLAMCYQERYEIYREALDAVTPISHHLASLEGDRS